MNPKEEKEKLREAIHEEDSEKIQENLEFLDEKLGNEAWREKALSVLESAINATTKESLERNLVDNINSHLHPRVGSILLSVLANNNPKLYQAQRFEVSERCADFLAEISMHHGMKVKQHLKEYYTPNDWRYIDTEVITVEREGAHLYSTLLKWNGETVIITTSLADAITLANHFVENINVKFDKFDEKVANEMLNKLEDLENNIEDLKTKIETSKQK